MADNNSIRDTAEAVKGIVEAVPVYQDMMQPAAKQVGTALETMARTVNMALAPISGLVWGYEQIKDFVSVRVAEKLRGFPADKIQTPDPTVAGPALEALKYTGCKEDLHEMYANLLANAINVDTASSAHPGFVDMIRNLTSDEAKILHLLSSRRVYPIVTTKATLKNEEGQVTLLENVSMIGTESECANPDFAPKYIDNLVRLGLLVIPPLEHLTKDKQYEKVINQPMIQEQKVAIENNKDQFSSYDIVKRYVKLTALGHMFATACIYPPKKPEPSLAPDG